MTETTTETDTTDVSSADTTVETMDAATKKISDNNAKLNAQLKAMRKELDDYKATVASEAEARQLAEDEKAAASSSIDEVRASLEAKAKRDNDAKDSKIAALQSKLDNQTIDLAIKSEMLKQNVLAGLQPILAKALRSDAKVMDDIAVIDGLTIADYLTDYLKTDEGMNFVAAPVNSGGGATGSKGGAGTITNAPKTAEEWTAFHKLAVENPQLYATLSKQFGMSK